MINPAAYSTADARVVTTQVFEATPRSGWEWPLYGTYRVVGFPFQMVGFGIRTTVIALDDSSVLAQLSQLLGAQDLPYGFRGTVDAGSFAVRMSTTREKAQSDLETVVGAMRRLAQAPPEDKELSEAVALVHAKAEARTDTLKKRSADLVRQELYFGSPLDSEAEADAVEAVSPEDVRMLASEWIARRVRRRDRAAGITAA